MDDERWIEAEYSQSVEEDDEPAVGNLFADPDPYDTFVHKFGPHEITLVGYKAENSQTIQSTGLTLWRAAPLLCVFLHENPTYIRDKRVLELGAGLGLCGIFSKMMGANEVFMTDGDTDTLAQLRENVKSNECAIACPQLRWGHRLDEFIKYCGQFDVLLAADIIYLEDTLEPLFDTVVALMKEKFVLSYTRRNVKIYEVLECAERHSLSWSQPDDSGGIFIFEREAS